MYMNLFSFIQTKERGGSDDCGYFRERTLVMEWPGLDMKTVCVPVKERRTETDNAHKQRPNISGRRKLL